MKKGYLVYEKKDSIKNKIYIKWLIEEANKKDLEVELLINNSGILNQDNNNGILYLDDNNFNSKIEKINSIDFVINRSRDYKLTEFFEGKGIRVFNKSKFCLLGNDKLLSYDFISDLDINYPNIYKEEKEVLNNKKKIIVKPKAGHGGEGIKILQDEVLDFKNNVYQEFIEDYVGDIRFYVINNEVINSVIRKPKEGSLVSNFTKGGNIETYNIKNKDKEILNKILENIEIDYGGIDFLLLKNGEILFNEFEDAVGSRMLSALNINNTMELFLNHIRDNL